MRIAVTLVLSLLMLGTVAWGQAPVPVGDQFQVNTYTTDQQWFPSVGAAPDGRRVVLDSFGSGGNDTSGQSVQGQRFAADGTPMGSEFQVNTYTTGSQFPIVRVTPTGTSSWCGQWRARGCGHLELRASRGSATTPPAPPSEGSSRSTPTPRNSSCAPRWRWTPTGTSSWCGRAMARTVRTRSGSASRASASTPPELPWVASSRSTPTRRATECPSVSWRR